MKLELRKGTLTLNNKKLKINKKNFFFSDDVRSVKNPIQMTAFLKHFVILYYAGPNFLTLKVAGYLNKMSVLKSNRFSRNLINLCGEFEGSPESYLYIDFASAKGKDEAKVQPI